MESPMEINSGCLVQIREPGHAVGRYFFFFNDTATTEIYTTYDTLSLHVALPISLPWDHIRTPVVKKFLLQERAKAYAAALTPDCRDHACYRCGAPCFTPKAKDGRRVSLQLAPGQGQMPETLDFKVPDDVTTRMIETRVEE